MLGGCCGCRGRGDAIVVILSHHACKPGWQRWSCFIDGHEDDACSVLFFFFLLSVCEVTTFGKWNSVSLPLCCNNRSRCPCVYVPSKNQRGGRACETVGLKSGTHNTRQDSQSRPRRNYCTRTAHVDLVIATFDSTIIGRAVLVLQQAKGNRHI